MNTPLNRLLKFPLYVSAFFVVLSAPLLAQTWVGVDLSWTNPDTNSFGAGTYNDGNVVTFDDSPGSTQDITLGSNVAPGSMVFTNDSINYVIRSDNGAVGVTDPPTTNFSIGGGTLTKSNNGTVTFIENNATPFTFGNVTVNGGRVYFRVDQRGFSNGFNTSFGSGSITLNSGSTFKTNLIERDFGGTNKRQYNLTNALNVNGNVELEIDRGGGFDSGGNSDDYSVRFNGAIALNGEVTYTAGSGGGGQGGGHGIDGAITIDQSASGNRSILRGSGEANQGFSITSSITDGVGGAGNELRLSNGSGNASRRVRWEANGDWAGGTRILDVGATELEAAGGQSHTFDVLAGGNLGLGDVYIETGGLLTLQHDAVISDLATLTIESDGFIHIVDGVNETVGQFVVGGTDLGFGTFTNADTSAIQGLGSVTVIPEPSTMVLIVTALGGMVLMRSRKR